MLYVYKNIREFVKIIFDKYMVTQYTPSPQMKFSTDEPAVSSSFKEKVEDVSTTDQHETIARLQGW